jgi:PAS domain S-box-containing protein
MRPFRPAICLLTALVVTIPSGIETRGQSAQRVLRSAPQFAVESWNSARGLQQNSLISIVQAPDGFIWVGTQEGIARFDGARFVPINEAAQWAHRDLWVHAMLAARDGSIWVGTRSGLNRYRNGSVTPLAQRAGTHENDIRTLCEDEQGGVWAGTRNGLARYDAGGVQSWTVRDGLPSNHVNHIIRGNDRSLWVATDAGVCQFRDGRCAPLAAGNGLLSGPVNRLFLDRDGALWILAQDRGVIRHDGFGATLVPPSAPLREWPQSIGVMGVTGGITADGAGRVWVAAGGELSYFENGRMNSYDLPAAYEDQMLNAVFSDQAGDIWAGSSASGLLRVRQSKFSVLAKREGLTHDVVASVLESADGSFWIGTDRGLNRIKDGHVQSWLRKDGLPDDAILSLNESRDGSLWVGTMGGVCKWRDGRFTCFTSQTAPGLLPDARVFAFAEGPDGSLWLGTRSGLARYKDGKFDAPGGQGVLRQAYINGLLVSKRDGSLWMTTTSHGLLHLADGVMRQYAEADGLPSIQLNSITEDASGALWIGTEEGLTRFAGGAFKTYSTVEGLPTRQVFAVVEDDLGSFWISSNQGVLRIAKSQFEAFDRRAIGRLSAYRYGAADGMRSEECNASTQPIAWKTRDGRILFPTMKGAVMVEPARIARAQTPPAASIEHVLADRQPYLPGFPQAGLEIGPDVRHLEIGFTGLSLAEPSHVRFKYRLEGVDQDWAEAGARRSAVYNRLAPGRYRFRVVAGNAEGAWSGTEAVLTFRLQPLFYQTWWFFSLILFAGAAVVYGAHRARLTRTNEQLLRQVTMSLPTAMAVTEAEDAVTILNQQFVHDFGYRAEDIRSIEDWFRCAYPDERQREAVRAEWRTMRAASSLPLLHESRVTCKDGTARDVEYRFAQIRGRRIVTLNDVTERKHAEAHLRELASRLQTVREEEREFISREIHDELGQLLTGLKLEVKWLENKLPPDSLVLREKTETILELINDTIKAVRNIATEFRPSILDSFGLMEAIEWQVEDFEKRSGIRCEVIETTDTAAIDRDRATAVFRILQESLTNVARHAEATLVIVSLREEDNHLVLQVEDDGRGITPAELAGSRSLGLLGMRERCRQFNGQVSVVGVPGEGTTVTATLPLEPAPALALAHVG